MNEDTIHSLIICKIPDNCYNCCNATNFIYSQMSYTSIPIRRRRSMLIRNVSIRSCGLTKMYGTSWGSVTRTAARICINKEILEQLQLIEVQITESHESSTEYFIPDSRSGPFPAEFEDFSHEPLLPCSYSSVCTISSLHSQFSIKEL